MPVDAGEIEEEVALDRRPFIDRYYTKKYMLSPTIDGGDYAFLIHSNRLALITLAPSHPIIKQNLTVISINFKVSFSITGYSHIKLSFLTKFKLPQYITSIEFQIMLSRFRRSWIELRTLFPVKERKEVNFFLRNLQFAP